MRVKQMFGVMLTVLFLMPIFAEAYTIDRDLSVGEYFAAFRDADTGWRIEGSFSVDGGIEFFICDASNYTRWTRNESVMFFEHIEETSGESFNFTIPYNSTWYVVFSNVRLNGMVVSLEAELFFIDRTGITLTQVSWIAQSAFVTPLFIGFIITILIVCVVGIWLARRGEPQPAVRYEEILPKPNQFKSRRTTTSH